MDKDEYGKRISNEFEFITPHEEMRFRSIENITDTDTAVMLYSLIEQSVVPNTSEAVKLGIQKLFRERVRKQDHKPFRYYCTECGFIGAASMSYWKAKHGSYIHEDSVEGCSTVLFRYESGDWDHENVEELVEEGKIDEEDYE